MDKKIEELKKRFEALEKERQTLLEQRGNLDKKVSEIVVEQLRIDGGLRALLDVQKESAAADNESKD